MSNVFSSKKNLQCRICNNDKLDTYLDLGDQPPSNSFIKKQNEKEEFFPLKVQLCNKCGLSQLDTIVSADNIFDDYLYLSSTSKALVNHYRDMTQKILRKFNPKKDSLIIDIGSNDGITLKTYPLNQFNILGIEPSSASDYAIKDNINTEKTFFTKKTSNELKKKYGLAKIITATNVFAHNDNIKDFVDGIKNILEPNGIFVIEFPYIKYMLDGKFFDVIYHEHYSYLSITPLKYLFKMYDLIIHDIDTVKIGASGPALRVYITHKDSIHIQTNKLSNFLELEKKNKFKDIETYKKFSNDVKEIKKNITNLIEEIYKSGKKIGAFGAPAKGNTLLNYLNLNGKIIKAISENSPIKIGRFTPGSKIPIVSDSEFEKMDIKYALLLSWNYLDFFITNSSFIKKGGKFLVPFPKPKIVF